MYLRRKVFSCQPSLEDIINEVEERAFSAGYEQRMFDEEAEEDDAEEKRKKNFKRGAIAAGAGLVGAGLHGYDVAKYLKNPGQNYRFIRESGLNPKDARRLFIGTRNAEIALGTAALGTAAYGAHKMYKNRKKSESETTED